MSPKIKGNIEVFDILSYSQAVDLYQRYNMSLINV